jgi:acyl transferase domain-containing protein
MSRLKELLDSGTAIAVVGMALRVPGARNVREYWTNLRGGVESIRTLDDGELERSGIPRSLMENPSYVKRVAPLEGMDRFDAGFFGFSPRDAAILDPQHRHFLETAWEALEDAGHPPGSFPGPVGVYAGSGTNAYFWANLLTNPELVRDVGFFLLRHTGNDKDFLSTRVSYEFDLKGPSVNVQTACSTSLVAVHLGIQGLLSGECDLALAGGVTIEQPHGHGYLHREGEILSPDGHCRAFDAAASGTVFGSGVGVVVLRRLEDAVADGNTVHAVILGSAVNNDGSQKVGYLAPSVSGQARAIAEALGVADVDPASIGFVAAHGTGTNVGDPIEVEALTQGFRTGTHRTGYCALGSVKSNIGHLDTAAGVASLIQAVCALKAREIPPTVHFKVPNPAIHLSSSPFFVPSELTPWTGDGPRRAAVNSLGVGGTNAFVILEEAPAPAPSDTGRSLQLLLLSGRTRRVLEAAGGDLADFLEAGDPPPLSEVGFTLARGRRAFRHRRALVAASAEEAVETLVTADSDGVVTDEALDPAPGVAFLFAGGGSQYPGMGRDLYREEPVYREVVDDALSMLDPELSPRIRALLLELPEDPEELQAAREAMERPSLALPALFITQLAQSRLWMSWGIRPASLLGHSMGEYTAACLAGVLSRAHALSMVVVRGRLFETVDPGGMLSVSLSEEQLRARLPAGLSVAAVNAPELTVASGPLPLLEELEERLREEEVEHRRVRISIAAHSSMLEPILREFADHLGRMELHPPEIPFVSNLSGEWITPDEAMDPGYWVRQLRETVRFAQGVRRLAEADRPFLVEVGPGRTLATLARLNVSPEEVAQVITSMRHPDDDADDLRFQLTALGRLWAAGAEVDWEAFFQGQSRRRVSLPTYPFERERHFVEPGNAVPLQFRTGEAARESTVAGDSGDPMADWFWETTWEDAPLATSGQGAGVLLVAHARGTPPAGDAEPAQGSDGAIPGSLLSLLRREGWDPRPVEAQEDTVGWRRILEGVEGGVEALGGILHLPLLGALEDGEPVAVRQSFDSLLHLLQALGEEERSRPLPLVVAAFGMQAVGTGDRVDPWKSLVLGPVRVAPREIPWLRTRVVDLDVSALEEGALGPILSGELKDPEGGAVVAWRNGVRHGERFRRISTPDPGRSLPIAPEGAYLLTGGLGGLGLAVARDLAERGARGLILVSRSGLPPREHWPNWKEVQAADDPVRLRIEGVEALEALGCHVATPAVDVTDEAALVETLAPLLREMGPLRGVLHAAGVLDDAPILAKDREGAHRVLAPKVAGTAALSRAVDRISGDVAPDFLVLFSSRSSISGVPGQVDYTAANAFLDAWARSRSSASPRVVSVEWDVWRETGMAARLSRGGEAGEPSPLEVEALEHPLFRYRLRRKGGEETYLARFREGSHWMLDEHRLREGTPLIPGSGFLEILRSAHALREGEGPVAFQDVLFLQPFLVPPGEEREMAVRLRPSPEGGVEMAVLGRRGPHEDWTEHVRGRAHPLPLPREGGELPTVRIGKLLRACRDRVQEVDGAPGNPILDFGPRWSNLRRIHMGRSEAVLALELPPEFRGDLREHPLHPALLDVATGTMQTLMASGAWNGRRGAGADASGEETEVYIPASYSTLELREALPPVLYSHVRLREGAAEGMAIFDVSLLDEEGREVASVEEFVMLRVGRSDLLSAATDRAGPPPPQKEGLPLEGIEEGLATADGMAALHRILASPHLPPVVGVIPRDLHALLAELDEPGGSGPAAPEVDVSPLLTALLEHPAVADAAAVAHPYGEDGIRVVAFLVYDPVQPVTVSEVRRHLRENVPPELVPRNFVEMTEIPRDGSGRVDRSRLSDPFAPRDSHVPPRTPTEEIIAGIWKSLLGLPRVGIHDNFLDVGGHSLVGIRVLLQIEKRTGVRLHPNALTLQTLEQLAAECDRRRGAEVMADEAPQPEKGGLASRILNAVKGSVTRP